MVKWDNLASGTNYLGLDEDGPYAAQDLEWYYDGTTWDKIWIVGGSGGPGVFGVRVTALVGGDLKQITLVPGSTADRTYHRCLGTDQPPGLLRYEELYEDGYYGQPGRQQPDHGLQCLPFRRRSTFVKLNSAVVPATTYVDATVPATPSLTLEYFVTAVFNDSQANSFLCESPGSDTVSFVTRC